MRADISNTCLVERPTQGQDHKKEKVCLNDRGLSTLTLSVSHVL